MLLLLRSDFGGLTVTRPVQFYSVALSLVFLGAGDDDLMTKLAWSYVGFRVIHSLVQSTINRIMVRFTFFMLSSLTLFGMTAKAAMMLF